MNMISIPHEIQKKLLYHIANRDFFALDLLFEEELAIAEAEAERMDCPEKKAFCTFLKDLRYLTDRANNIFSSSSPPYQFNYQEKFTEIGDMFYYPSPRITKFHEQILYHQTKDRFFYLIGENENGVGMNVKVLASNLIRQNDHLIVLPIDFVKFPTISPADNIKPVLNEIINFQIEIGSRGFSSILILNGVTDTFFSKNRELLQSIMQSKEIHTALVTAQSDKEIKNLPCSEMKDHIMRFEPFTRRQKLMILCSKFRKHHVIADTEIKNRFVERCMDLKISNQEYVRHLDKFISRAHSSIDNKPGATQFSADNHIQRWLNKHQ